MSMNNNGGWVKLHRSLMDWEWYADSNMVRLFIHCILKANHKPAKWQGVHVARGQFVTGLYKLSEETGISVQTLRTCLQRMNGQELTSKSTNRFSVITVLNYDSYQAQDDQHQQANQQTTNKQLTNNQQTTNNKQECKEGEEGKKKIFMAPSEEEVSAYMQSRGVDVATSVSEAERFTDHHTARGWVLSNGKRMSDWRAAVRTWVGNMSRYNGYTLRASEPVNHMDRYIGSLPNAS